jgi:hypothetical protein
MLHLQRQSQAKDSTRLRPSSVAIQIQDSSSIFPRVNALKLDRRKKPRYEKRAYLDCCLSSLATFLSLRCLSLSFFFRG